MAFLEQTLLAKVSLWLKADAVAAVSDAGEVLNWSDSSGNGNNFTNVHPGGPALLYNTLNGRPVVDFTGGKTLGGPTITNFLAANSAFVVVLFKVDSIATNNGTNNLNDCILSGSTSSSLGIYLRNTSPPRIVSFNNDGAAEAVFTSITTGTWTVGYFVHAGGSLVSQTDPFTVNSTASGNTAGAGTSTLGSNYNATTVFTGQIAELLAGSATITEADKAAFYNYLQAKWLTRGDAVEQARWNASERIFLNGRPFMNVTAKNLPAVVADIEVGTDVSLSHVVYPHPAGSGAANSRWERALVRTLAIDEDMDNDTITFEGVDLRKRIVTYVETFEPSALSTRKKEGIVCVSPIGASRQFQRYSNAYAVRPTDGLVAKIVTNEEAYETTNGLMLDDGDAPHVTNPWFATAALSGWTTTPGTGGATVASETTASPFWCDTTSVSANNCKLTQGSPAGADNVLSQNLSGVSGNKGFVIIRHRDDASAQLFWRLSRASDGKTWDDSGSGAWSGSTVDNGLTISTSILREHSKLVDFTVSTTYTLSIRQKSGGTASRVNRVYEVHAGTARFLSSPAPTAGRTACAAFIPNNSGYRVLNAAKGCMRAVVLPQWNSADLAGTERQTVFECYYDASNWFRGYYDAAALSWIAEGRVAGTTYKASLAASVTMGTEVQYGMRWCGAEGEQNLSPYTLSVFVGGTKGTDVVMSGTPAETTNSHLYIGTPSQLAVSVIGTCINGYLRRKIEFRPVVFSDLEMAIGL